MQEAQRHAQTDKFVQGIEAFVKDLQGQGMKVQVVQHPNTESLPPEVREAFERIEADLAKKETQTYPESLVMGDKGVGMISDLPNAAIHQTMDGEQDTPVSAFGQALREAMEQAELGDSFDVPGYERLTDVLEAAYDQAARGKGAERHADNLPFHEQPMQSIADEHGIGFITGQARKKTEEALGMLNRGDGSAAIKEILGAINYLAGAVIYIEDRM